MAFYKRVLAISILMSFSSACQSLPVIESDIQFQAFWNDAPIGTHVVAINQTGSRTVVDTTVNFSSKGLVFSYVYTHKAREIWENSRLVSLESTTSDNGTPYQVSAKAAGNFLIVNGSLGVQKIPLPLLTTAFWNPALIKQTQLLDSQKGYMISIKVAPPKNETIIVKGQPTQTQRYELRGDLPCTIWYDTAGRWCKLSFQSFGGEVHYERR